MRLLGLVTVCAVLGCGFALLFLREDARDYLQQGLGWVEVAGPGPFFAAMVVLPAVGVPMSLFSLTAGVLFRQQLGIGTVLVLSLAAVAANMALCHVLANRVLRPLIERLLRRLGHQLPALQPDDVTDLIVLVRATPGVPFAIQNYLLGLAGIRLARYLLVSSLIAGPLAVVMVLFGEAVAKGNGLAIVAGLMCVVALAAALHWSARRRRGTLRWP